MTTEYTTSADYYLIESALKSLWQPFNELIDEMNAFVPRSLSDFDEERRKLFERYKKNNPTSSDKSLTELVEKQIVANASAHDQYINKFSNRFMNQYVMVTFISHALCEAIINAILATGFFEHGFAEEFTKIEKKAS